MHQILKLEAFHQSHTRIPSENEASAFEDFWKPGGQTFPGNMPEGIMKDISTQRGEHMEHSKLTWEDVSKFEEIKGYGQHVWRHHEKYFCYR
ncbi:MAG: hypothetical protein ACLT64_05900 [Streptococcus salivarius]